MKLIFSAVVAALGAASAAPLVGQVPQMGEPATLHSAHPSASTYLLRVIGEEKTCTIALIDRINPGLARLELEEGCANAFEPLAAANYWVEGPDGDVFIVTEDAHTVAQFFPGDGVAYESLRPVAPLMMLTTL